MQQLLKYALLITFCIALSSCAEKPKLSQQELAAKHFQDGEKLFEAKMYTDAIAAWEKVRDTFYSPELSMLAEIKIADTYFISEQYMEASTAYADYLAQHPNAPREGTILFRLGLSYYKQILSADRDQTSTENALITLNKFLARFPTHIKTEEAKVMVIRCQSRLAEHEVYVGRFYLKNDQYKPAIKRLEGALKTYPDYYYRDEAYYYLTKAYVESDQLDKASVMVEKLKKEFPRSSHLKDAQKLLEQ